MCLMGLEGFFLKESRGTIAVHRGNGVYLVYSDEGIAVSVVTVDEYGFKVFFIGAMRDKVYAERAIIRAAAEVLIEVGDDKPQEPKVVLPHWV